MGPQIVGPRAIIRSAPPLSRSCSLQVFLKQFPNIKYTIYTDNIHIGESDNAGIRTLSVS